jgi:hypothetical protein
MPRARKPRRIIRVPLFDIGKPTAGGRVYTEESLAPLLAELSAGKKFTIEEMSPIERKLKGINEWDSWAEHSMAESVGHSLDNGVLSIDFELKGNRFGKLLGATLDTYGENGVRYFPVGTGEENENVQITSYKLSYISFEIKEKNANTQLSL